MERRYEELLPISKAEADERLSGGDVECIAKTLISVSLHDEDWRWVQQRALYFLTHESEVVVSAAILSLGHTARRNHSIDKTIVIPALRAVATNRSYEGKVQDAIDDIESYVGSSE